MFTIRQFNGRLYYMVVERQIGLRNFAKIQFHKGYSQGEAQPRIGYARDAAFTPQSKINVQNHNILKSGGSQTEADFKIA